MAPPISTTTSNPPQGLFTFGPPRQMSTAEVICRNCGENGFFWSWNFSKKRPHLVDKNRYIHRCAGKQRQDIFPGWCHKCSTQDLSWVRTEFGFELVESYGLPHMCLSDSIINIQDISSSQCRHCKQSSLLWLKREGKFQLYETSGEIHACSKYDLFKKEWAEAKRMNYSFEKEWLNSIPDDTCCKKCKGTGFRTIVSNNKRIKQKYLTNEPITLRPPCLKCKKIGTFSQKNKKLYLKRLRIKYWPFRSGIHKWKKYDSPEKCPF